MPRRRLVGTAGRRCWHGSWRSVAARGSTPAFKACPSASVAGQSAALPAAQLLGVASEKPVPAQAAPVAAREPVLSITPEVVHDNGRRPRFATPGGRAIERRYGQGPDGPGGLDAPSRRAAARSSRAAICGRWRPAWLRSRRAHRGPATCRRRGSTSSRGRLAPGTSPRTSCPILTRLGCNTGSCHGTAGRAERLPSLALRLRSRRATTRPGRGTAASAGCRGSFPKQSLFLVKATGRTPHGGGRRLAVGSPSIRPAGLGPRRGPEHRGKSHGAVVDRAHRAGARSGSPSRARGSSAWSPNTPTATSAT